MRISDWSSDVCSSDLVLDGADIVAHCLKHNTPAAFADWIDDPDSAVAVVEAIPGGAPLGYMLLTAPDLPIETGTQDTELKRIYPLSSWHGAGKIGRESFRDRVWKYT